MEQWHWEHGYYLFTKQCYRKGVGNEMEMDKERLKELNRECFLLMTGLAEMATKIDDMRKEIMEANDKIIEELDE